MRRTRNVKPRHRRAWWRLWRYCRCGHRWRCPASVGTVPAPYRPPTPRPQVELTAIGVVEIELTEAERAEIRALSRDTPPPPPRTPASNRRPGWNGRAGMHPRLTNGRAGNLTPAQEYRARHGVRA